MISRPAIYPVLLVLQPQVRLPADSNGVAQLMQLRTLILIGDRFARRRAWFFSSMSLTTEGGKHLTLLEVLSLVGLKLIKVPRFVRNSLERNYSKF